MTTLAVGALATHRAHILVFGIPTAVLLGWVAVQQLRRRLSPLGHGAAYFMVAAAASMGVAAVHASVASEHFHEALIYGLFFTFAAAAQVCWPAVVLLSRNRRRWLLIGAAANLVVIALWAYTRVIGVPLGPGRGTTERVGIADIIATSCELLVVTFALLAVRASSRELDDLGRLCSLPRASRRHKASQARRSVA